ncbi:hypothetical protein FOXG_20496 [Fusarium oxysporum f. sp. lycopersici 4287]|uniref:Uncharacterized protein n=2 Tax=Fusarium oxysporum TaxID=5507 RepID=A0A0J9WQT4_FUSO4|nr:hypothetical protein FOXG_20496 [Fusarium oxysporum f. sp. lycopersici 4287]EXK46958.1 hypothetical protein FOMG_00550 [Fusarium oxysporum f. sp. melonis 26406]KNB11337.1 hypothetical protein FOXG_20496 [Fusarium oxysporum f. sp. lycopersici 4287]
MEAVTTVRFWRDGRGWHLLRKKLLKNTKGFHRRKANPLIAMEVTVTMYTSVSPVKLEVSQQLDGYSLTVPSLIGPFFRTTVQHAMPVKLRVPHSPPTWNSETRHDSAERQS